MAKQIKLLGIAPYEELNNSMTTVGKQFPEVSIDIFTADLEEGQKLVAELAADRYDAIISRGGTASLINQVATVPVIDVSISVYDILGAIKLAYNYTENFAIVGYPSITETAHIICDILQYNIRIVTIGETTSPEAVLDSLQGENFELILCDAVTHKIALTKSIDTLLITSGFESIKHAYQQAIALINDLKAIRQRNELLLAGFMAQSQRCLIFDQEMAPVISNISADLTTSIRRFLSTKKDLTQEQHFYHTKNTKTYHLTTKPLLADEETFLLCEIKDATPPLINNSFGVEYLGRSEIEEALKKKLLFSSYIQDTALEQMEKLASYYNAMMIFGENGTAKTSLAYTAFLKQKNHTGNLIVINSKLLNERMWKYLLNATNGPLVEVGNTILFKDIEQISPEDAEKLLTIINHTKLLQKNNLLFTYSTKSADKDKVIFNRILTQLDCSSIYSPAMMERKHELPGIITRLLNKVNIESNKEVIGFDPNALKELLAFTWPGNLNQLEQVIKKLVLNANSYYISEYQMIEVLKQETTGIISYDAGNDLTPYLSENKTLFDYSREIILAILEQNDGNQTKTAKQLGISRTTLWRYLKID